MLLKKVPTVPANATHSQLLNLSFGLLKISDKVLPETIQRKCSKEGLNNEVTFTLMAVENKTVLQKRVTQTWPDKLNKRPFKNSLQLIKQ